MYSIGYLAKVCGISRSTILYYDEIGLLKPNGRSEAGYRFYDEASLERLRQILVYRDVGIPLMEIAGLFDADRRSISASLLQRLKSLTDEISKLKEQQMIIIRLLEQCKLYEFKQKPELDWLSLVRAAGIEQSQIIQWHEHFERHSPEQHYEFLTMVGFSEEEIQGMRDQWNRKN